MDRLDALIQDLRERGQRITLQRRAVLEIMVAEGHHLTAEDVLNRLAERDMPMAVTTVYRVLEWLKENGLVCETDLGQSSAVYSLIEERSHHHLVCLECKRVFDIEDRLFDQLRAALRAEYGFEARVEHLAIFGLCRDCREGGHSLPASTSGG